MKYLNPCKSLAWTLGFFLTVIAGLLPAGAPGEAQAFTYLVGRNGAGKTFLLLDWAMHIAAGMPWQGRAVQRGPVLYVYGEGTMKRRVAAWRAAHRVPDGATVGVTFVPGVVNLLDERDVRAFLAEIQRGDHGPVPVLVILETFTRMTPGGKENDPETHSHVLASTGLLQRELGAAVVLSGHTPWATDQQRPRGHSMTPDGADAVYLLENPDNAGALRLSPQKNREDEWPLVITLKLTRQDASLVIDADRAAGAAGGPTSRGGKSAQTRETILHAMVDGATWGIAGLMAATGLAKDSVRNHLQALEAAGRVVVVIPTAKRGQPKGWRVAGDSAMGRSLIEREIAPSQSPNPDQATGFGDLATSGENRSIAESPNAGDGGRQVEGRGDADDAEVEA